MSNTKHTPGPWERIIFKNEETGFKIISGKKPWITQVCEATEIYMNRNERHANAKLIAAAPTLLDALEDLLDNIPKQTNDHDWWEDTLTLAVGKAKAAIKKATE